MILVIERNIIIDTNILINYLEKDKENLIIREKIIEFIRNGGFNNKIIFAGSKMYNEITYNKNNYSLLELLVHYRDIGENPISIFIESEEENQKLDKEIAKFKLEKVKGSKRKGDPHIIYIANKYKVHIIFTDDVDLTSRLKEFFCLYFNATSCPEIRNSEYILYSISNSNTFL